MQYRQGDVFVEVSGVSIESFKSSGNFELLNKDEHGRIVLAYGEATGHAHAIKNSDVRYYREKNTNKLYLVVDNTAKLQHEEHKEIELKPKVYEVIRQREYTPKKIKYVAD